MQDSLSIENWGFRGSKTIADGAKILQIITMALLGSPDRRRRKQTWLLLLLVAKHHLEVMNMLSA